MNLVMLRMINWKAIVFGFIITIVAYKIHSRELTWDCNHKKVSKI
jgi:hypothetical protein